MGDANSVAMRKILAPHHEVTARAVDWQCSYISDFEKFVSIPYFCWWSFIFIYTLIETVLMLSPTKNLCWRFLASSMFFAANLFEFVLLFFY